ncbi:Asp-tRNA(Asn)/Glu-tRNA(Gln) amidotransferase subunit GatC [Patescibacteria group bacterium]
MKISRKDVEYVARLARLGLEESEVKQYTKELSKIIEFVEQLNEVDTSQVEPTAHSTGTFNIMRADSIKESTKREEMLKLVPAQAQDQVKVKGVFK